MPSNLIANLNEKQLEAVTTTEGPVLILAGAGSGKTRVITIRTAYLIAEKNVRPHNILAVTFTNKAADEMRERIFKLLTNVKIPSNPLISTFHSFCARILRREIEELHEGYTKDFAIYDSDDSLRLIKSIMKQVNIDEKTLSAKFVQSIISGAKNRGVSVADHLLEYVKTDKLNLILRIVDAYQNHLRKANALDFDDLLLKTVQLFKNNDLVRAKYNELFKYIMVDEYQDTNPLQFALIRQLTEKHQNICVVGDDNQSIYAFRYADIRNILDFEKHFPSAKIIKLEQNYRSTQTILEIAEEVIKHNQERKEKTLWTLNPKGDKAFYFNARDEEDEARFVASRIKEILRENPGETIAVLYRTNAQSRLFEEALRRENIKYRIVGALSFYQRAEIKDITSYLKLILNPLDDISLERVINNPPRGIGDKTLEEIRQVANANSVSLWEAILLITEEKIPISSKSKKTLETLRNFRKLIESLKIKAKELKTSENPVSDLLITILRETGYEKMLIDSADPQDEARLENLNELINAAFSYDDREDGLREFIDHAALTSTSDNFDELEKVTLMTVHSAKGLEFSTVFLVGMEEGIFPHIRSASSDKLIEEERRLCYVAITRAKKHLYVTHARQRRHFREIYANEPSTFLKEMPASLLEDISEINSWLSTIQSQKDDTYNRRMNVQTCDSLDAILEFFKQKKSSLVFQDDKTNSETKQDFANSRHQTINLPANDQLESNPTANQFFPGDYVIHKKYGKGLVLRREGTGDATKLTINFPGYGQKKIIVKYADLKKA